MNWDAIGAVGQMLGSIAVVVSMVYAGLQVQQAKTEVQRSISQHRADSLAALLLARATNQHLCEAFTAANAALGAQDAPFVDALTRRAGLTLQDANALQAEQQAWWLHGTQIVNALGELSAGERAEFEALAHRMYTTVPVSRLWYESTKAALDPDVVRYIEGLLARPA